MNRLRSLSRVRGSYVLYFLLLCVVALLIGRAASSRPDPYAEAPASSPYQYLDEIKALGAGAYWMSDVSDEQLLRLGRSVCNVAQVSSPSGFVRALGDVVDQESLSQGYDTLQREQAARRMATVAEAATRILCPDYRYVWTVGFGSQYDK